MTNNTLALDQDLVQRLIEQAVQQQIATAVQSLTQDPVWVENVERLINQAVTQRAVSFLRNIDLNPAIKTCVDENMAAFRSSMLTKFSSTGIDDRATTCQLTVMDDATVVENQLMARELEVLGTVVTKDLAVKGNINVNNRSWDLLADAVSEKTMVKVTAQWRDSLIAEIKDQITQDGIKFDSVKIGDELLVSDGRLSSQIVESKIQSLGNLRDLTVNGEANLFNTVMVKNKRLGINTESPEMALSVWDEEVSVVIGKNKLKQAYIGTNRDHSVVIGVNRTPQIEIDVDGLTTIKQLRVGVHRISHAIQVPGWSGTRGDMVFNSNPTDRVFAWVCLGGHRWQTLKSAE